MGMMRTGRPVVNEESGIATQNISFIVRYGSNKMTLTSEDKLSWLSACMIQELVMERWIQVFQRWIARCVWVQISFFC